MRGTSGGALSTEERSHGAGVPRGVFKQVGRDHQAAPGTMDSRPLGGSLQLPEGGKDESAKNRHMDKR